MNNAPEEDGVECALWLNRRGDFAANVVVIDYLSPYELSVLQVLELELTEERPILLEIFFSQQYTAQKSHKLFEVSQLKAVSTGVVFL